MSTFDYDSLNNLLEDPLNEDQELPAFDDVEEENENLFGDVEGQDKDAATNGTKVELKKRTVRNPRLRLTVDTLRGPRGIQVIEDYFKDMSFQGKGNEVRDLDEILRRMQHWAHRMYPNYKFDDVLSTVERLGRKRPLQVHMSRYRLGLLENAPTEENILKDADDAYAEANEMADVNEPFDEFDALLDQQIAMTRLEPHTPASKKRYDPITPSTNSSTLSFNVRQHAASTPNTTKTPFSTNASALTAEQIARIEENKRLARERLEAKRAQADIELKNNL